jgi:hypothetical protein
MTDEEWQEVHDRLIAAYEATKVTSDDRQLRLKALPPSKIWTAESKSSS